VALLTFIYIYSEKRNSKILQWEIREGDAVEFDLKEGRKGLNAVDVRVI